MFLSAKDHFGALPASFWGKFFNFLMTFKHFAIVVCNNGLVINQTTITLKINAACPPVLKITLFFENHSVFLHQNFFHAIYFLRYLGAYF